MNVTQQLIDEHECIKSMLSIIEKIAKEIEEGGELNPEHFEKILDFIKGFADKNHHHKEEDILFPAMVKQGVPNEGGPIAAMLHEHQSGRNYVKGMSEAFDAYKNGNKTAINDIISNAMNYVQLLRNHIEKENNILFKMAEKVLNEEEQMKIFDAFERVEEENIGISHYGGYHQLLVKLKSMYLK
jgi:hemerythrin-like domain-containing protein